MRNLKLNPALRNYWRTKSRYKVLYGGRASSKSHDAAGVLTIMAQMVNLKIVCTRMFQNRIQDSIFSLLKAKIWEAGLQGRYKINKSSIECIATGSQFLFYGLARNIDEIKSLEGVDIFMIEEAHNLTAEMWKIIEPTVRKQASEVWIIFNPQYATDFVYKRFVVNPPPDTLKRLINYVDNPFLSETMLKVIAAAKAEDPDEFEHVYMGVPKMDQDGVVFKMSWLRACIDAHLYLPEFLDEDGKPSREWFSGERVVSFDVADDGEDKNALVVRHGSVAMDCEEWKGGEDKLMRSCTLVWERARNNAAAIRYDSIGVGAFAGSKIDELNESSPLADIAHSKFNAGAKVANPEDLYIDNELEKIANEDYFANYKAQAWWCVADRARNTYDRMTNGTKYPIDQLLSISSSIEDLDALLEELSTPKRDFDNNGKVKVESKKDLKKRDVPSPNRADAFVMAFAPVEQKSLGFFDM